MLKKYRRIIGLFMVFVMAFALFAPAAVQASQLQHASNTVKETYLTPSDGTLLSARGSELSTTMYAALTKRNVEINNDTLVEIKSTGKGASAVVSTNVEGTLVTKNVLLAIDEDGQAKTFTQKEIASLRNLDGGEATIDPFDNSFTVLFIVSFYGYHHGGDPLGIVQPQTAMFLYSDTNDHYDVVNINMTYRCMGIEGTFVNGVFTDITGPQEIYSYNIAVSKTGANENTYYSRNRPISSGKAVKVHYEPGGVQKVDYVVGVRETATSPLQEVEDFIDLQLYNN